MAAALALVAALLFALAATLQQKGAMHLQKVSFAHPMSLIRLGGQTTWLIGTLVLGAGYLFQAAALDRGRLSVIQPLLVSTVVFALPMGYFLTRQHVGRREVSGAVAIVIGLGLFVYFGDPAGGKATASNTQWAITMAKKLSSATRCNSAFSRDSPTEAPVRPIRIVILPSRSDCHDWPVATSRCADVA